MESPFEGCKVLEAFIGLFFATVNHIIWDLYRQARCINNGAILRLC